MMDEIDPYILNSMTNPEKSPNQISPGYYTEELTLERLRSGENKVTFSPDGRHIASVFSDSTTRLWDVNSGGEIIRIDADGVPPRCVAFSPNGQLLYTASSKSVMLWDPTTGARVGTLAGPMPKRTPDDIDVSPDGAILAITFDNKIQLYSTAKKDQLAPLLTNAGLDTHSVGFSPDGKLVAAGTYNVIFVWEVASNRLLHTMRKPLRSVWAIVFSPDGALLASGSHDNTVRLWETVSGNHVAALEGHKQYVASVAFSHNGRFVVSGDGRGSILLWDVASRSLIAKVAQYEDEVVCVRFSPGDDRIALSLYDGTVRILKRTTEHVEFETPKKDPQSEISTKLPRDSTSRVTAVKSIPIELSTERAEYINAVTSKESPQSGPPQISSPRAMAAEAVTFGPDTERAEHAEVKTPEESPQSEISDTLSQSSPTRGATRSIPLEPDTASNNSGDISNLVTLSDNESIGSGGFGELFLGNHHNLGKVALKRPHALLRDAPLRRFLREVDLWRSVSHPYVLQCLGTCKIGRDVYMVSPYIENGDLMSCIQRNVALNRAKLLYEVAEALAHLHHNGIVHGDVKATNILLSPKGSALLCDFGLAKAFDTTNTSTDAKGAGSIRWMAPEMFEGESRSMASDVYSFGITIAEVLSGRVPFYHLAEAAAVLRYVLLKNGRPLKDPLVSPEGKSYDMLWETAEKCWATDASDRPYMVQVAAMLFPSTRR